MHQPTDTTNADRTTRLLDLLPEAGSDGFGAAMLRLAHAAAALHRAEYATRAAEPWSGLTTVQHGNKDKAGQGRPARTRSARASGPVTREGDR